jgi:hypothetical protein
MTTLSTPTPGLRTLSYDARSPAKVTLVVQPGDRLDVSDDVAAQLQQQSAQFKSPAPVAAKPDPAPAPVAKSAPVKKAAAKKAAG